MKYRYGMCGTSWIYLGVGSGEVAFLLQHNLKVASGVTSLCALEGGWAGEGAGQHNRNSLLVSLFRRLRKLRISIRLLKLFMMTNGGIKL